MKTTLFRHVAFALLTVLVLVGPVLQTAASARPLRQAGAQGPIVLRVDPASGLPVAIADRGEIRVEQAVPVPSVMNGSAFGLSGTDYYSDELHEGPLRRGVPINEFVLAPALRAPLQR